MLDYLPQLLLKKSMRHVANVDAHEEAKFEMKMWEMKQNIEIANATMKIEGGKIRPKFSNETARQAELNRRAECDEDYQHWLKESESLARTIAEGNAELEYIRRRLHSFDVIANVWHGSKK